MINVVGILMFQSFIMPQKKQRTGHDKAKTKEKKLLEAAALAVNQKSLLDCFQKCVKEDSNSANGIYVAEKLRNLDIIF